MPLDFRFGLGLANGLGDDPALAAVQAEDSGFDVVVIGDHIGPALAPMPTLAAIAAATSSIRLGTMVLTTSSSALWSRSSRSPTRPTQQSPNCATESTA